MEFPNKEAKRKTTAIPRLYKKLSFDSAVTFSNEYQDDNLLNRSSSDPNQQSNRTSDSPTVPENKNKKLYKFTLNENVAQNSKKEEVNVPGNNESDDEVNSTIFSAMGYSACEKCESQVVHDKEDCCIADQSPRKAIEEVNLTDDEIGGFYDNDGLIDGQDEVDNIEDSATTILTVTNTAFPDKDTNKVSKLCELGEPVQSTEAQNTLTQTEEEKLIRNRLTELKNQNSPRNTLQEAYLKNVDVVKHQQQPYSQFRWNIINPMYKNIALGSGIRPNIPLNPSIVSDIDVKTLTKKEESSDIDTDDESFRMKDSPRSEQTNCALYNMYNLVKSKDMPPSPRDEGKHESLVNTFLEVFGNDSHIIQKLRSSSPRKYDDRFRKLREDYKKREDKLNEMSVVQDSPRDTGDFESCKSKLVQDLYKNDDVFSTITQSSNERSVVTDHSKHPKEKSSISVKGCGCEIKHLQLNEVQKSIADIHHGIKTMLAYFPTNTSGEIALELAKLRRLYEESLICQRKSSMQSKRLHQDIQNIYCTLVRLMESQKPGGSFYKYLLLPILGAIAYFVVTQSELCKKIPVTYE